MSPSVFKLIAVHGGAGVHDKSFESEKNLKRCLKLACKRSLTLLNGGSNALTSVECAIQVLEDDPCLNAGFGSNLTLEGTVECDASLMDGQTGDFGAVGAISGIKNPVLAASAVLHHSRRPDPIGRIPPLLLVSRGAEAFARQHDTACISPDELIAPRAMTEWTRWKARLDSAGTDERNALRGRQDTVGALVWDASGGLSAGVSSGGLLLKHSGRVGEAALFGAGCWAQQGRGPDRGSGVACSLSGSGEYIARSVLAKTMAEAILQASDEDVHDILHRILTDFYGKCRARGEPDPSVGILLLTQNNDDQERTARLWCAFTTESMAIAYASSLNSKPKALVLRRNSAPRDADSIFITALPLTD